MTVTETPHDGYVSIRDAKLVQPKARQQASQQQLYPSWVASISGYPLNRIQGKLVRARAFAHERQQSPVSYVGINIVSRTILKTMYRTVSKSTFDDESR